MPLNRLILGGNLTRSPEVREVGENTVTNFTIAHNPGRDREAYFIRVAAWGKLAELCAEYLTKGSSAVVDGRLEIRKFEKDGQERVSVEMRADNVQFGQKGEKPASTGGDDDDSSGLPF